MPDSVTMAGPTTATVSFFSKNVNRIEILSSISFVSGFNMKIYFPIAVSAPWFTAFEKPIFSVFSYILTSEN